MAGASTVSDLIVLPESVSMTMTLYPLAPSRFSQTQAPSFGTQTGGVGVGVEVAHVFSGLVTASPSLQLLLGFTVH